MGLFGSVESRGRTTKKYKDKESTRDVRISARAIVYSIAGR